MASNNNKLLLIMSDFSMGVPTTSRDTITGIASLISTSHTHPGYTHFPMPTRFPRTSAACAPSIFANSNPTSGGAESHLLRSSTEDVVTNPATSVDNVKSKIHPADGQDHRLSTIVDQWALACVLIDLASWVALYGHQISRLLTICFAMGQRLTLDAALPAPPPPPPQKPRQWKQHSPEPQQAVIPRSWPSSSASSSS